MYCVEVWGNAADSHLHPLNILQNNIIRTITFSYYIYRANTNKLYVDLGILPLHKLVTQRIAIMMFKYANNMLPKVMNELYLRRNSDVHSHNTRRSEHLHIPNGTHTKNFVYRSVLIWNELVHIKVETNLTLTKFKKILKLYLLHNELKIGYTS